MSKKHFIALADAIRTHNDRAGLMQLLPRQIEMLANFCASTNPRFNRERWINYIAGKCGPNGGAR